MYFPVGDMMDRLDLEVTLLVSLGPSERRGAWNIGWLPPSGAHHHRIASPRLSTLQPSHISIRQFAKMAEGMFYNVTAGYIEGIVRGYRNTLLTGQNYGNLTQCETIDGMATLDTHSTHAH